MEATVKLSKAVEHKEKLLEFDQARYDKHSNMETLSLLCKHLLSMCLDAH